MLDRDLTELYGVETKALNQAVKRNIERFPERYRFQLNERERDKLVTNCDHLESLKYSTVNPYAFTEQGVSMLASVLKSDKAVQVSLNIIDAFVAMRRFLLANAQVFQRIETLEMRQIATDNKLNQVLSKLDDNNPVVITKQRYSSKFHDRFIIIDDTVYHVGASLKDLGKRLFAFTRMEIDKSIITAQL